MLYEKHNTGIEKSEELELSYLLNNLSQSISKHETAKLSRRFPVLVHKNEVDIYETWKLPIVNDDDSRYISMLKYLICCLYLKLHYSSYS